MANVRRVASLSAVVALLGSAIGTDLACSTSATKAPTTTPSETPRIVISADGVRPAEYAVRPTRVEFFNADSETHRLLSDSHPEHNECPEMINLGVMGPQRSVFVDFTRRSSRIGRLMLAVCRYHDETRPDDRRFRGSIVIR